MENALYVSFDDGDNWVRFNNNLPPAPVYGLTVQEQFNDLVVGTYGRGFWILDDLSPLQRLTPAVLAAQTHLFAPRPAYRWRNIPGNYSVQDDMSAGQNPPFGAGINFWLKSNGSAKIEILDSTRKVVRTMNETGRAGLNRVYWNLQGDTSRSVRLRTKPMYNEEFEMAADGTRPGFGSISLLMPPGRYTVRLTANGVTQSEPLEVRKDPHSRAALAELHDQMRALVAIQRDHSAAAEMVQAIEDVRVQLQGLGRNSSAPADIRSGADELQQKFIGV